MSTKKAAVLLAIIMTALVFSACQEASTSALPRVEDYISNVEKYERMNLKLGVVIGPYGDLFMETILPLYSKKGYDVELVHYSNYDDPNFALARGDIDMNMFQHYQYLNNCKLEHDLDLSAISEIPTVSMGIYSHKYKNLSNIRPGTVVAIPGDNTNMARALTVMEAAGMILLDSNTDKTKVTTSSIVLNPFSLRFAPMAAQRVAGKLGVFDLAVINGNYALDFGLALSDALYLERLSEDYINVIAIRTEDLAEQFVSDLIDVLRSEEYMKSITDESSRFAEFQRPLYFKRGVR